MAIFFRVCQYYNQVLPSDVGINTLYYSVKNILIREQKVAEYRADAEVINAEPDWRKKHDLITIYIVAGTRTRVSVDFLFFCPLEFCLIFSK